MIGVLVGVACVTLLKRKVLGYIQIRLGPNRVVLLYPKFLKSKLAKKKVPSPGLQPELILWKKCICVVVILSI